ncbi:MAG: extracellular solute-binding protein [Eubacteriales bacterium]|nr:extracellular solute-binding protein [Eubacteriales bacterium]
MKTTKKWLSAVMCAALAAAPLAGVHANAEEVQEITIAFWNADECFAGDEVLSTIEETLGIQITPMNITWDDYTQKIQLWASSGSLPDVFVGDFRNSKTFTEWAAQGVIKAIPEDLSAYPNLETYMADEAIVGSAKVDGTVYCIPRKSYPSQEWTAMDREIAYRWDLAQEAGITKEPATWEEFDAMIQAIIVADPEGTGIQGMTANTKGLFSWMFLPYASSIICDQGIAYKWVLDEDGLYKPAYFTVDVLPAFQLMRDLYEDGTIEKDIALTNNQSSREKFLQGKSAAILFGGGVGADNYNNVAKYWEEIHGSDYLEDVKVLNLMPDKDGNLSYCMADYAWSETYINSAVEDAKLDKILELYDYLLSDEGGIYATYGPEGELYDLEDGAVKLHEGVDLVGTYPSLGALKDLVKWSPVAYDESYATDWPEEYNAINRERAQQAAEVEMPEYYAECTEKVKALGLDFSINLEDDTIAIMTGSDSVEEMWADLVKQYQSKGLDDVIAQVNEAMAE